MLAKLGYAYPVVSADDYRWSSGVQRPIFPKTLREFQSKFGSEEACASTWSPVAGRMVLYVPGAGTGAPGATQFSVDSVPGAGLADGRDDSSPYQTPLMGWFWAAYLMTTDKRGVSALLLQRQLALPRFETAWVLLHKLRRAMVNLARESLRGEVQVDDARVGGTQAGLRGSRQLKGREAVLVIVAVEKRGRATGRARMAVIPDFKSTTLIAFLKQNVARGSRVCTDGLKSFTGLQEAGFQHVPRSQPLPIELRKGAKSVVPLADRAARLATCSNG